MFGVEDLLAEPGNASVLAMPRHDRLENLRVLVVDDDMLVRTSTAGILESWGCHVSVGEGLEEVWKEYSESHFDLVICDYRLPDGNGLQLADRIQQHCDIPPAFILISGDTSPEILQAVNERGHHLLHKPVRPAKLRSLMLFMLKKDNEVV
jgi:CheY-like chemotaxis protein